jgi:hypothetical protein
MEPSPCCRRGRPVERQPDLFGAPWRLAEKSQLWTPLWLARRIARRWVHRNWRVLEPCVGSGNLIDGLEREGHSLTLVQGLERDGRWVDYARTRFDGRVSVLEADFLHWTPHRIYDVCVMNPPYEENQHLDFVLRALELTRFGVIAVVPNTFEYSEARDHDLWQTKGVVNRRAILPERVKFAEGKGGEIDCHVLMIARRQQRRRVGEERMVYEETWRPDDIPEAA